MLFMLGMISKYQCLTLHEVDEISPQIPQHETLNHIYLWIYICENILILQTTNHIPHRYTPTNTVVAECGLFVLTSQQYVTITYHTDTHLLTRL